MLDLSLDWNYISFFSPLYTPLWANASTIGGAIFVTWFLYPVLYFTDTLDAYNFPPMSSNTFDSTGNRYNITAVLTPEYTLNQTAMDDYSIPRWSTSYASKSFSTLTPVLTPFPAPDFPSLVPRRRACVPIQSVRFDL